MAEALLESSAISAFCGSVAVMLSAGIQTDEAVHMLGESHEDSRFKSVCSKMYGDLIEGMPLSRAMERSHAFPDYAVELVSAGESSGRLESVLRNLELYYDEEDRVFSKLRTSVGYPAALLCVMAVILAVTVAYILPVFTGVYANMSGSITAASSGAVTVSMVIGWLAFAVTLAFAALVVKTSISVRTEEGRLRLIDRLAGFGPTKDAVYQLSLSRFTAALATYAASGISSEDAMSRASDMVRNEALAQKVSRAYQAMVDLENPRSLAQAIAENDVFDPFYARMLAVGALSGSVDETLANISETFFDDAVLQMDRAVNNIEPILAAFLTIAVGATLISVMLPLIGIMTSVG